jgi:ankyrin repeat protein
MSNLPAQTAIGFLQFYDNPFTDDGHNATVKSHHEPDPIMNVIDLRRSDPLLTMLQRALLLILLLVAPAARAADPLSDTLQKGLLAEEVHHDLDAAIAAYQSVINQHDDQRRLAATALFRLGECYRKQGKSTAAVAQYQRLLAEFSDQAELARLSRQNLDTLGAGIPVAPGPLTPAAQRQKDLLAQELALVEQQIAEVQKMIGVGRAGSSDLIPLQREALALQRQMAALDDARRPDLLRDVVLPSASTVDSPELADGIGEEEMREIERLKEMIRNSPDLLNAPVGESALAPLHSAALKGQLGVVRLLLDNGASVDVRHNSRRTPLHFAVFGGHKAITELLIDADAQVLATDDGRSTPLHVAAEQGFLEIARVLLQAGADVNAMSISGTPLHAAVKQGQITMIDLLLDRGADLEARTADTFTPMPGCTPLLQAVSVNYDPGVVERLLARGANVNATNAAGNSVLHATIGIESENTGRALQAILEKEPNLEVRGSESHPAPAGLLEPEPRCRANAPYCRCGSERSVSTDWDQSCRSQCSTEPTVDGPTRRQRQGRDPIPSRRQHPVALGGSRVGSPVDSTADRARRRS